MPDRRMGRQVVAAWVHPISGGPGQGSIAPLPAWKWSAGWYRSRGCLWARRHRGLRSLGSRGEAGLDRPRDRPVLQGAAAGL